jgi:protein SCO1/2
MQKVTFPNATMKPGKTLIALCQLVAKLMFGLCIGTGLTISVAGAEEQPPHSMHNMSDMSDMKDMQGMEHMDHSKHMQSMEKRGSITSTVVTYRVPDVMLVDENGKQVRLRELLDGHNPIMLNFIFTTCTTICPVMTSTFHQVQEKLGKNRKDVRMVSISIDPENDTPGKLKEYAAKNMAGTQWKFLTGTVESSVAVQKAFDTFAGEKMNHKPLAFIKAKGSDSQWVRVEGLAEAGQILNEYDKLAANK